MLILAGFVPAGLSAYRVTHEAADPEVIGILNDLTFGLLAISGIPTAIALSAYAAVVLRGAPLPAWTAWLAVVGAVAHVVIAASFAFDSGFFSLEGDVIVAVPATYFAWILATSLVLLRRQGTPRGATPTGSGRVRSCGPRGR